MQEIEDATIVDAEIVGGNLILTKHDGTTIDAGPAIGPVGPEGPPGSSAVPGEVKLWAGTNLPDSASYGNWAWANGDPFDILTYPIAAANISSAWNTAHGLPAPPGGMFRVPDLRGLTPACLDALPVGSTRIGRVARPEGIQLAKKTGEETHRLVKSELAKHSHGGSVSVGGSIAGTAAAAGSGHFHNAALPNEVYMMSSGGQQISFASGSNIDERCTGLESQTATDGTHTHTVSGTFSGSGGIGEDGSDGFHETMQPTVMVPYIVFLGV
jgi:microcystin-dependent protein